MTEPGVGEDGRQIVSMRKRGAGIGYRVTYKKIIPIPGLKQKTREELGYPGVGRWTRSAQALGSKSRYRIGLFLLFLPLMVYVLTLGNYFHSYLLGGPFLGSCILISQLNTSRKLFKNGATLLKLSVTPEVGGEVSGIVRFAKPMRGCDAVEIKLICHDEEVRSQENRSVRQAEYWSIKQEIGLRPQGRESIALFSFEVPEGLPVNDPLSYYWSLELRGMGGKKSMFRSWRMPIDTAINSNSP